MGLRVAARLPPARNGGEAARWLFKEWTNVLRVRDDGMPIVGFTWYSLTDQVDWDTALREDNGRIDPLGLYDLDRNIRAVGREYKQLIADWSNVLPVQSQALVLPIVMPTDDHAASPRRRPPELALLR